ncbi:hypothetical protein VARIO8X_50273 [Burkholderiales bacterium 8X]|nr:hypothetical protein VARIO8X_50273 [Burkholderiales bacterium 8X]
MPRGVDHRRQARRHGMLGLHARSLSSSKHRGRHPRRTERLDTTAAQVLRRPPPSRLPLAGRHLFPRDDGRQRRARHQLLDGVPEVPVAGARRLRGGVALAAVPAVLVAGRRPHRPHRSAPHDPVRPRSLRTGFGRMGLALHHGHPADLACHGAAGAARMCRCLLARRDPGAAARRAATRAIAERRSLARDVALPGPPGRSRGRRRDHADRRPALGSRLEHAVLPAGAALALACAVRPALPKCAHRATSGGARLQGHLADPPRGALEPAGQLDDPLGRPRLLLRGEQLPGPDAGLCERPRSRRSRHHVQHAARSGCSRCAARGRAAGKSRRHRRDARPCHRLRDRLVRRAGRIRDLAQLPAGTRAAVRRGHLRARVQLDGAVIGAAQRARRIARPGHRSLQHVGARAAVVRRPDRRARRERARHPCLARGVCDRVDGRAGLAALASRAALRIIRIDRDPAGSR